MVQVVKMSYIKIIYFIFNVYFNNILFSLLFSNNIIYIIV